MVRLESQLGFKDEPLARTTDALWAQSGVTLQCKG